MDLTRVASVRPLGTGRGLCWSHGSCCAALGRSLGHLDDAEQGRCCSRRTSTWAHCATRTRPRYSARPRRRGPTPTRHRPFVQAALRAGLRSWLYPSVGPESAHSERRR